MKRRRPPVRSTRVEEHRLRGNRKGAVLKEQIWFEHGSVVAYSLAYINLRQCAKDNGRVLGYDNSHGYHHRHFMGKVEPIDFLSYEALSEKFIRELHELWRIEDEQI